MSSNIANLSELDNVLCNNEKTCEGVLQIMSAFKIGRFFSLFEYAKSKGWRVAELLFSLIVFRLRGESINSGQSSVSFLPRIDDNFGVGLEHCHFPVKNAASLKYDYSNN